MTKAGAPIARSSAPSKFTSTTATDPPSLDCASNRNGTQEYRVNCIQNFHLVRYIAIYRVGNLVLRRRASGTVKLYFRTRIRRYTSQNENFEYGYPHSNALLQFRLKLECCKPHNAAHHLLKCDVINDVKLFPTVYCRI